MVSYQANIRLCVDIELTVDATFEPDQQQAHYLLHVMRLAVGNCVLLFNGRDGEWRAEITDVSRKSCKLRVLSQTRPQITEPDVWLMFAPIKKTGTHFILEKATELGVSKLIPVITQRTGHKSGLKHDKFVSYVREAAEQCERLTLPVVENATPLITALAAWPDERILFMLDETGGGLPIAEAISNNPGPAGFLTGPEGGFTEAELAMLKSHKNVTLIGVGPRILRAETAALSALACWQSLSGDWNLNRNNRI